jgi:hypothetical protein
MNVFILCTGRSGSKSLIKACSYINNYTVGHETLARAVNDERLSYPKNHIEADNRLSWFLGRLDKVYSDKAFYVHLKRAKKPTVNSFVSRWDNQGSIIKSYAEGILLQGYKQLSQQKRIEVASDYYDTVNENIALFLKDKSYKMTIELEKIEQGFEEFYDVINAEGDKAKALHSLKNPINTSSESKPNLKNKIKNKLNRLF